MATEKRLIDAMNTVTKISKRVTPLIAQGCHQQRVYAEVLQVIADAPTVDAVDVVRCKDCRFYEKETVSCSFCTSDANWYEEDFCSYGERIIDV